MNLSALNRMDAAQFVSAVGGVFEHSPWVAEAAFARKPFASVETLHRAMLNAVSEAGPDRQLALLRAHPELAGREAKAGELTADSSGEQGRLGFTALSRGELAAVADINRRYQSKFGFPCIVALALHANRDSVIAEMERRIANDVETERKIALEQIGHITRSRLERLVSSG
jgi:chitin deacetylase